MKINKDEGWKEAYNLPFHPGFILKKITVIKWVTKLPSMEEDLS